MHNVPDPDQPGPSNIDDVRTVDDVVARIRAMTEQVREMRQRVERISAELTVNELEAELRVRAAEILDEDLA
jgi:hypothetical protein